MPRTKTTLYLDLELADYAAKLIGASSRTDAVEAGLRQLVAKAARDELRRLNRESELTIEELDRLRAEGWR